jgi:ubiquitin thioesterase protein OTUB1
MEDYEATVKQMESIRNDVSANTELIGELEPTTVLLEEYDDEVFCTKLKNLVPLYPRFRRTRGDGNCFYRSFGFGYMEMLCNDPQELERVLPIIKGSLAPLLAVGYPELTTEDFYDAFVGLAEAVQEKRSAEHVLMTFRDSYMSDFLVVYLRILASGHLQIHHDDYAPFIEGGRSIADFRKSEVDPMGVEADHLQIKALCESLGVCIRVSYIDRSSGSFPSIHDVPDGGQPVVHLLYRPGHYDLLYPA